MTDARQAASGYALSALPRIKDLHHFPGHQPAQTTSIVKHGGNRYIYRWEWPGILRVYARGTGLLLAESLPGQPGTLSPSFTPPRSEGDPARG